MKLSSIKLKRTSSVFTDLVTVCLHARTHTQPNMQSHVHVCMYFCANCVLLRKHVCVSFMRISCYTQIGRTVTQPRARQDKAGSVAWYDAAKWRRGAARRGEASQSEASCGACSTQRILFQFGCEATSNVRPEKIKAASCKLQPSVLLCMCVCVRVRVIATARVTVTVTVTASVSVIQAVTCYSQQQQLQFQSQLSRELPNKQ